MLLNIPFKKDTDQYYKSNYKCTLTLPKIIIENLSKKTLDYYPNNNIDYNKIIKKLDFKKILKPAFIFDPLLQIFALIDNDDIIILNFDNKINNFSKYDLKKEIISTLLIKLRYYKIKDNYLKLLIRFNVDFVLSYITNENNYKLIYNSISNEKIINNIIMKRNLYIENIKIKNDITLSTPISKKQYIDSKSTLTLNKSVVTPYTRILIKYNIIFNNYKLDNNCNKKTKLKNILLKHVNYINNISEFIENNDQIINNAFNILYGTEKSKYRLIFKFKSHFDFLKIMIESYYEYINKNYNNNVVDIESIINQFIFNIRTNKKDIKNINYIRTYRGNMQIILKFKLLKFTFCYGSKHYFNKTYPEIINTINNFTCYKHINNIKIDDFDIKTFNFTFLSIIISKIKDYENIINDLNDINNEYLIKKLEKI